MFPPQQSRIGGHNHHFEKPLYVDLLSLKLVSVAGFQKEDSFFVKK